jgi:hypothetical protein
MPDQETYRHDECGALLAVVRTKAPATGRAERATCPHCSLPIKARDGEDLLGYTVLQRPYLEEPDPPPDA